uniref:Uncharacterized protein n=1 Tax=Glossina palpalis gambiensis TaxID=67801 RepID=A0A1B0AZU7_9MUSC
MGIIGLQALVTLAFVLVLLENNCHGNIPGNRNLHYCASWFPSPKDVIGRYIYQVGQPPHGPNPCVKPDYNNSGYFTWQHGYPKDGFVYRHDDQSSGTHPCRGVRIDNRIGHYFSVSGSPSEDANRSDCIMLGPPGSTGYYVWNHTSHIRDADCADWIPGYDGKEGSYKYEKGTPPNDPCVQPGGNERGYYIWKHGFLRENRSRLIRNKCWVFKFSSEDGYYISEEGNIEEHKELCVLPGPENSKGYYIWTHGSYDDPCVRYAGNERPGQNGTGGYYRWEHGYVTSPTDKDCASWEPGYDRSTGNYTFRKDSDGKCIFPAIIYNRNVMFFVFYATCVIRLSGRT